MKDNTSQWHLRPLYTRNSLLSQVYTRPPLIQEDNPVLAPKALTPLGIDRGNLSGGSAAQGAQPNEESEARPAPRVGASTPGSLRGHATNGRLMGAKERRQMV